MVLGKAQDPISGHVYMGNPMQGKYPGEILPWVSPPYTVPQQGFPLGKYNKGSISPAWVSIIKDQFPLGKSLVYSKDFPWVMCTVCSRIDFPWVSPYGVQQGFPLGKSLSVYSKDFPWVSIYTASVQQGFSLGIAKYIVASLLAMVLGASILSKTTIMSALDFPWV